MITYRTTVQHTARYFRLWGEAEPVVLQLPVCLPNVEQVRATLSSHCPILDQLQHFLLHVVVEGHAFGLEERHEIVHELPRRNLRQEMRSAVLDTCIRQLWDG